VSCQCIVPLVLTYIRVLPCLDICKNQRHLGFYGLFEYEAAEGFAGTDSFTYTTEDGHDRPATVRIEMSNPDVGMISRWDFEKDDRDVKLLFGCRWSSGVKRSPSSFALRS